MQLVIAALVLPLILLNLLGGITGGIWLAIASEWRDVGLGVIGMVFGTFVISLGLMIGLVFAAPMAFALNRGHFVLAKIILFPSLLLTYSVLGAWCGFVAWFFYNRMTYGLVVPYSLWIYAVATAPISFLNSKDRENPASSFTTFFVQLGCAACCMVLMIDPRSFELALGLLMVSLFVGSLVSTIVGVTLSRQYSFR